MFNKNNNGKDTYDRHKSESLTDLSISSLTIQFCAFYICTTLLPRLIINIMKAFGGEQMTTEIVCAIISAISTVLCAVITAFTERKVNQHTKNIAKKIDRQLGLSDNKTLYQYLNDSFGNTQGNSLTRQHDIIEKSLDNQLEKVDILYNNFQKEQAEQTVLQKTGYDVISVVETIKAMSNQLSNLTSYEQQLKQQNLEMLKLNDKIADLQSLNSALQKRLELQDLQLAQMENKKSYVDIDELKKMSSINPSLNTEPKCEKRHRSHR